MADQKKPAPKKALASISALMAKKKSEKEAVTRASELIAGQLESVNNKLQEIENKKDDQQVRYKSAKEARLKSLQGRSAVFNLYQTDITLLKKMYPVIGFLLKKLDDNPLIPEDEALQLIKKIYDDIQELKKGEERTLRSLDVQLIQLNEKIDGITRDIISKQKYRRLQFNSDLEKLYRAESLDLQELDLELSMQTSIDEEKDLDLTYIDIDTTDRIDQIKQRTEAAKLELERQANKDASTLEDELQKAIRPLLDEQKNIDGSIQFIAQKYVPKWENELNRIVAILDPAYTPTYSKQNLSEELYKVLSSKSMTISDQEVGIISKATGEKRSFTAQEKIELRRLRGNNADKISILELVHIPKLPKDYFERAIARAKTSAKLEKEFKKSEKEDQKEEKVVRRIVVKRRAEDGDEDEVDNQLDYEDEADENFEIVEEDAQIDQEAAFDANEQILSEIFEKKQEQKEEAEEEEPEDADPVEKVKEKSGRRKVLINTLTKQQEEEEKGANLEEIEHELDEEEDQYDSEDDEVEVYEEFNVFQPTRRFARYTRSEEADESYMTPEEQFLAGGYTVKDMPDNIRKIIETEKDTLRHEANQLDIYYSKIADDPARKRIVSEAKKSIEEAVSAKIYPSYKAFATQMLDIAREQKPWVLSESIHSIQLNDDQRLVLHDYLQTVNELELTYSLSQSKEFPSVVIQPISQPYAYGKLRESLKLLGGKTTREMIEQLNDSENNSLYKEFIAEFFESNIEVIPTALITRLCYIYQIGFTPKEFTEMGPYLTIEQYALIKEYTKRFPDQSKKIAEIIYSIQIGRQVTISSAFEQNVVEVYMTLKAMPIHERLLNGIPLYEKTNVRLEIEWLARVNRSHQICKVIEDRSSYPVSFPVQKVYPYVPTLLLTKLREVYASVSGHRTKHLLKRMLSCQSMSNDQYLFVKLFMHDASTKDEFQHILESFHHVILWVDKVQNKEISLSDLSMVLEEWYATHRVTDVEPTTDTKKHATEIFEMVCFVLDSVYTKQMCSIYQEVERLPSLLERLTRFDSLYRAKVPKSLSKYFSSSELTFLYDSRKLFLTNYRPLNFPIFGTIYDLFSIERTVTYFINNPSVKISVESIKQKVADHYQELLESSSIEEMNIGFQFDLSFCAIEHYAKSIIKASAAIIQRYIQEIDSTHYATMILSSETSVDQLRKDLFEKNVTFAPSMRLPVSAKFPVYRGDQMLKDDATVSSAPSILLEVITNLDIGTVKLWSLITRVNVYDLPNAKVEEVAVKDETNYAKISRQLNQMINTIRERFYLFEFTTVFDQLCLSVSGSLDLLKRRSATSLRRILYEKVDLDVNEMVRANTLVPLEKLSRAKTSFVANLLKSYRLDMKKRSKMLASLVMPVAFTSRLQFSVDSLDQILLELGKYDVTKVFQEDKRKAIELMEAVYDLIFQRMLYFLHDDLDQLDRFRREIEKEEESEEIVVGKPAVLTNVSLEEFLEIYKSNPNEFRFGTVPNSLKGILFYIIFNQKAEQDYVDMFRQMVNIHLPESYQNVKLPELLKVVPTLEQIAIRIHHYLPSSRMRPDERAHRSIVTDRFRIDMYPALMDAVKHLRIKGPIAYKELIDMSSVHTQESLGVDGREVAEILEEDEEVPLKQKTYESWYKPSLIFIRRLTEAVLQADDNYLVIDNMKCTIGMLKPNEAVAQQLSKKQAQQLVFVAQQRSIQSLSGDLVVIPDRIDPRFVHPCEGPSWYEPNFQPILDYSELENFKQNVNDLNGLDQLIADTKKTLESLSLSSAEREKFNAAKQEIDRIRERLEFMTENRKTFPAEEIEKQKEVLSIAIENYPEMKAMEERLEELNSLQKNLSVYNESRLKVFAANMPKNIFVQIEYIKNEIERIQQELAILNLLRDNEPKKFNLNEYNNLQARLSRLTHQKKTIERYVPSEPSFIPYYEELMTLLRKTTGEEDKVTKLRRLESQIELLEKEKTEMDYELFAIHKQQKLQRLHVEFQVVSQNWMRPTKFFLSQTNRYSTVEEKMVETDLSSAVYRHYSNRVTIGPETIVPSSSGSISVKKLMIGGIGYTLGIINHGRINILSPQAFLDLARSRYAKLINKQENMLEYFQPNDGSSNVEPSDVSPFSGRSSIKEMLCHMCHRKIASDPFMFTFNLKENELVTLCSEECSEMYNPNE